MRTVPLAAAVLVGAGLGVAGWFLGRASVESAAPVTFEASRAEPEPIPRPMLEGGRGGGGRSGGPGGTQAPEAGPDRRAPGAPARASEDSDAGPALAAETTKEVVELAILNGFRQLRGYGAPALEAVPDPPAVAEAARLMRSSPEEANARVESLLESRDAAERAGAYRLLGEARHGSHQALVQRAQREAKSDDEIRSLLHALARFKGATWNAVQITGAPDTPIAGDLVTAWASKQPDMGEVWIDLEYAHAVTPDAVRVHETYNPGAIARVLAQRDDAVWVVLWEGTATPNPAPSWFEPRLEGVRFSTTRIRLIVDTSRVTGWNEIDAVELIGDGRRQWALAATAASNYSD